MGCRERVGVEPLAIRRALAVSAFRRRHLTDHFGLVSGIATVLDPLGGIAAAYIEFRLGFFAGSQVLASSGFGRAADRSRIVCASSASGLPLSARCSAGFSRRVRL